MRAINDSEAQNNLGSVLDSVVDNFDDYRRGDNTGERAVVVLSLASYNSMVETDYLLRGGNHRRLLESIDQLKAGKLKRHKLSDRDDAPAA